MASFDITSYSVVDLLSWQESGALLVSPRFQRNVVWKTPAKGFFIDSILREYPVPPIHIRLASDGAGRIVREVIDGQQRIRAIFDFIQGDYRIPRAVSPLWGGLSFSELRPDEQQRISLFSFTAYQYKALSDTDVLDIFARLNTYSEKLSDQELRNGKWFGEFKRVSYALAGESLEFWRRHRIFTELQVARMREAELVSELLVAMLDGQQDKKTSLDTFYANLDEEWGSSPIVWETRSDKTRRPCPTEYISSDNAAARFRSTLLAIDDALGDVLKVSPFSRGVLFYTLFCATYDMAYGLPRFDHSLSRTGIDSQTLSAMRQVAGDLAEVFDSKGKSRRPFVTEFYAGSTQQTDNIGPRTERLTALLDLIAEAR